MKTKTLTVRIVFKQDRLLTHEQAAQAIMGALMNDPYLDIANIQASDRSAKYAYVKPQQTLEKK